MSKVHTQFIPKMQTSPVSINSNEDNSNTTNKLLAFPEAVGPLKFLMRNEQLSLGAPIGVVFEICQLIIANFVGAVEFHQVGRVTFRE